MDKFKFLQVKQTLSGITGAKNRVRTLDLIHNLLFEREFYKYEIALQNNRNVQLLNQFYEFAEEFNSIYPNNDIEDFTDYLSFASNFEIEEKNLEEQAITISTVHGVKGMQYPVVIIPDVIERKLPTTYQKTKFPIPQDLLKGVKSKFDEKELHIQEERRLFYVAITRAKEKLIITYAKRYGENKTDSKPSRFLNEIDYQQNENINFQQADPQELSVESATKENQTQTRLMKQVISNLATGKFNEAIENVLLYAKSTNKDLDVKTELIGKIKEPDYSALEQVDEEPVTVPENHVFSVSQFVGYKKCPRLYQYRHVMKIPEKPRYYFDFGSSLHGIAEQLTRMQKEGKAINEVVAAELLAKFWDPKGYKSKIDEQRDYAEAKAILKVFLEEQAKSNTEIVDIERWFETSVGDIRLRGRIDRIDREGSSYTVVDYKTSKKAPSLNELKKDMQLLVYAVAVKEIYGGGPLKVGNWFLRSNEKVFFEPENQAIEAMRTEIAEMAAKIKAAAFEPKKGSWECTQCDYHCLCD